MNGINDYTTLTLAWGMQDKLARMLRRVTGVATELITEQPQGISESVPRMFFVDSGNSRAAATNDGLEPYNPFSTIQQAINACVASRGDIIMVAPGHVETVVGAAGLLLNKVGVSILGLGIGNLRPTVNFTTAVAASFDITAANCKVDNILFTGSFDAMTAMINVQAADFTFTNCETRDSTSCQMLLAILTTAAANRMLIKGYVHRGDSAAGGAACIRVVGGDGIIIEDFDIFGNFSVSAIDNVTTAATNYRVGGGTKQNYIQQGLDSTTPVAITCVSTSTGHIGPNINMRIGVDSTSNTTNITEAIVGAAMQMFLPLNVCNLGGEVAMATNITASTDA